MKTRTLLIGLVLLSLTGLAGWYGWRKYTAPTPPDISLEGVSPEKAKKIERALEEVRRNPRSGETWGTLGMTLMANGFSEQAVPCFTHAQRFDPKQPRWPYFHGTLLLTVGQREGFTKLRQALALTGPPQERQAVLFVLALALAEDGQLDEAEQLAGELRTLEGDSPRADFILGVLAIARDNRVLARDHLSKITEHPCARKRACALLAGVIDGNEPPAQHYRNQARELPDDQPWPNSFESDLARFRTAPPQRTAPSLELESQGRHEEALNLLRELAKETPGEASYSALGFALFKRNRSEEAVEAFRRVIDFNPRNTKAHFLLGASLFQLGEQRLQEPNGKEKAMELFRQAVAAEDKAIALQKDLADAHLTRGRALKHLARTAEAIESLRQAVSAGTEYAEMHQALGEALAEAGQLKEGLEHLEDAVRLAKPDDPRPREALEKWKSKAKDKPNP